MSIHQSDMCLLSETPIIESLSPATLPTKHEILPPVIDITMNDQCIASDRSEYAIASKQYSDQLVYSPILSRPLTMENRYTDSYVVLTDQCNVTPVMSSNIVSPVVSSPVATLTPMKRVTFSPSIESPISHSTQYVTPVELEECIDECVPEEKMERGRMLFVGLTIAELLVALILLIIVVVALQTYVGWTTMNIVFCVVAILIALVTVAVISWMVFSYYTYGIVVAVFLIFGFFIAGLINYLITVYRR